MPKESKKILVLFDFDGTLTTADSLKRFLLQSDTRFKVALKVLKILPFLLAKSLGIWQADTAKEHILRVFFKNWTSEKFDAYCEDFAQNYLPKIIRKNAWNEIQKHAASKAEIAIVSASIQNYIEVYFRNKNISVIATRMAVVDGVLSGKSLGKNCNKAEKVSRIKGVFSSADFNEIIAYGDTINDKEMLQFAHKVYYRKLESQ